MARSTMQDRPTIAKTPASPREDGYRAAGFDWHMDLLGLENERYGDTGIDERGTLGSY